MNDALIGALIVAISGFSVGFFFDWLFGLSFLKYVAAVIGFIIGSIFQSTPTEREEAEEDRLMLENIAKKFGDKGDSV